MNANSNLPDNLLALDGRVCLVTGASRGIGRAIALALGEHGGVVVGTATTASGAARIGAALDAAGIRGAGMALDVTRADSVGQLMDALGESFGAPAVLVNNAAITRDNLLLRMKESEWDEVADANLKSVYRMCRAALRGMTRAKFGRIINITSVVAATGNPGQANYAAAKAGLIAFSKSLAREVASRNITVNCVAPGFIDTDMTRALSDEQRAALRAQIPLARFGAPADVAAAALFLAAPAANYITGATLHVNGGMLMP
ncbi:MAG: 3-oxoacyl-ACP reductase FabG [Gammaproteobacteria bacterium]|nr:3-oxoacyl-ACP reductase FabG [Gammaproteobacteria bacterium]